MHDGGVTTTDPDPTGVTADHSADRGAEATPDPHRRLVGIDAFRGLVLAVMILTPATGENGSYPLLGHAPWNGFTVADAIFPAFLVTSGASLAFLLRPPVTASTRLRLVRRLVALLVIGVAYNAVGQLLDFSVLRLTGVLQLIGVTGALAALVILGLRWLTDSRWPVLAVTVALPLVYGISLAGSAKDCTAELAGCSPWFGLDTALVGNGHVYAQGSAGYDPEGIAIALVATSFVLAGYLAAEALRRGPPTLRTVGMVLGVGVGLMLLGITLDGVQPINKRLHTPAFSLLASGVALTGLAGSVGLFDLAVPSRLKGSGARGIARVRQTAAHPLQTLGMNALVVYLSEHVVLTGLAQTTVGGRTAGAALLETLPIQGVRVHLGYTAVVLGIVLFVTYVMRLLRWRVVL